AEAELRRLKAAGEYTDNVASQYHERQILKTNAVADEPTIILYNKMRSQLMSNKEQGITDPELEKRVMAEGIRLNDARLNRSLEYYNRPDVIDSMNPADRSKAI